MSSTTISNGPPGTGELGENRIRLRHCARSSARSSCTRSNDHSSLPVPTGPCVLCCLCPCWNAWLLSQRVEVLLRRPPRVDEEGVALVGRAQQLERFEAGHLRHLTGAVREPLDEVVGPFLRNGDRIDPYDTHRHTSARRHAHAVGSLGSADREERLDLVDELPAARRGGASRSSRSTISLTSGRAASPSSTRARYASAARVERLEAAGRRGVPRPAARAARAPPAATASPRRTGALAPTGPRTGCRPHRARAARWSACRSGPRSRDATGRPPARANGCVAVASTGSARRCDTSAGMPAERHRVDDAEPAGGVDDLRRDRGPPQRRFRTVHEHDVAPDAARPPTGSPASR